MIEWIDRPTVRRLHIIGTEQPNQAVLRDIDLDAVGSNLHTTDQSGNDWSVLLRRFTKLICNLTPALNQLSLSATADARALDRVEQFPVAGEQPLKPLDDDAFEISGGDATVRRMGSAVTLHEGRGHVVSVPRALLDRPCRREPLPGLVEEQAG